MSTNPNRLKFYTDRHIDKQVALQLRNRGVEVIRCEEVGLGHASDEDHWRYATENGCAIITKDDDFIKLHNRWRAEGKDHFGVFFCPYRDQPAIGLIVKECSYFYNVIEVGAGSIEEDIKNQVYYIT